MIDQAEAGANLIGNLADDFVDVRRLGDGAEGGALSAVERATGRRVVLKRIPPEQARAVRYAFRVLRRAGSPHLPAPRAVLTSEDGASWMVTDWVPGEPLPRSQAPRVADALAEARAIAHALAAIHGAGTHHGDVAPGNVIVTPTGGVVLVDLGLLGRHGLGTPGFLAPEVLAGGGGQAADRFSLGCLLCLRLLGEVPWRRPESLLEVRRASDVLARLDALGADTLDPPVRELLARLLRPSPPERVGDPTQLVEHLTRLHAAADAGLDLRRSEPWWPPARWPFRGPSLHSTVERLRERPRPRLVAVAGSPGVGRGRVIEELVQSLQSDVESPVARVAEAERLPVALGRPRSPWLEAWRTSDRDEVVGVLEPPAWPSGIADAIASQAAVVQQVAAQATATLVLPVSPELAEILAARGALVITVEPWSLDEVEAVLDGVVDASSRRGWAERLHAATGGWPAQVVRAAEACASARIDDPSDPAVIEAIGTGPDAWRLDAGSARAVMLAVWRGPAALDGLSSHLHDGERPWATVEAAARRRLGSELLELARDVIAVAEADGETPSLALAIDADRSAVVEAMIPALSTEPLALARWLDDGAAPRLGPEAVAAVMRMRLARGDVDGVLRLAPHAPGPPGRLVEARARQRRGELDQALACVDEAERSDRADESWSARGLRWRLWIDRGRSVEALAVAREQLPAAPASGVGPATARLWAAMAALVLGEHEQALRWLDESITATASRDDAEAAGVRARAHQLHGNLAQAQGQLREAQLRYARAAEAFEQAGEPIGGLMLRGSLAGLAVLALDLATGIEHGRAAIGGLLGQGQISATLEAGLNLVQLLCRVGAEGQAAALGRLLDELHAETGNALARARLERVHAELLLVRVRPSARSRGASPRGAQAAAEAGFVAAATRLADAGAGAEAAEAWRIAAGLARVQGQRARAWAHLERAPARPRPTTTTPGPSSSSRRPCRSSASPSPTPSSARSPASPRCRDPTPGSSAVASTWPSPSIAPSSPRCGGAFLPNTPPGAAWRSAGSAPWSSS
ncbi:MAG: hypothetical protein H6712_08110 [Myxococcales bacterium]|nr:hypothetical protein [Myxococcales bacterium]